jgi:hypothetical protein
LEQWVFACLFLGWLLLVAGARAAGAALLGSAAGALLVFFTPLHSGHLESLVHNAVIAASVGLVVFGLAGLAVEAAVSFDRYLNPPARAFIALASATAVGGTLVILRIHAVAAPTCSLNTGLNIASDAPVAASCFRGFEDLWVQTLLAFNTAFLVLLVLVAGGPVIALATANTNRSLGSPLCSRLGSTNSIYMGTARQGAFTAIA